MSTNKIALTASMRSNLLSLKNTQKLFDSTQDKLSTGYKVNSAMDNPSSYFTAQSLNARADDLSTLLDSIGQAISTLQTADQGITSLQDFVSQAKSIANSARDTANVSAKVTSTVKFDKNALKSQKVVGDAVPNAAADDKMVIRYGDSTKLTGTTNVKEDSDLAKLGFGDTANTDAGSIVVDGKEYKINVNADENSMERSYANDSVFKIVEKDGAAGTYTVQDADGNKYVWKGTITNTAADAHEAAVGDTIKVTGVKAKVTEDGKTELAGTFKLTDDGADNYQAATVTASIKDAVNTINVKKDATVEDFSKVVETMIGTKVFDVSIEDSNLVFKTLDTTSVEVKGKLAEVFGLDAGQEITL